MAYFSTRCAPRCGLPPWDGCRHANRHRLSQPLSYSMAPPRPPTPSGGRGASVGGPPRPNFVYVRSPLGFCKTSLGEARGEAEDRARICSDTRASAFGLIAAELQEHQKKTIMLQSQNEALQKQLKNCKVVIKQLVKELEKCTGVKMVRPAPPPKRVAAQESGFLISRSLLQPWISAEIRKYAHSSPTIGFRGSQKMAKKHVSWRAENVGSNRPRSRASFRAMFRPPGLVLGYLWAMVG